ncbi:steroid delta-isomerase [Saccharopolyspora antimicrobica]|uniref:Steroid delta-isomerase n=1 Tax=Saccharopolyspora antimicrobica TaxID=455193 RepID=A0A1I4VWL1_9PSEU|nr:nuclear transport factor 2 family protein [Saccharopolyspora antimicrobica]RKT87176.1 steroid delta-isomerase [Saccharopolyspora antimicrobica]SFN05623.1 steroid delta-isomerase [Saccharopolyspora antimicrobica]
MPEQSVIRDAVASYLKAVATGSAADVAALYAEDATLEDPVGSEPVRGRAAITEFYSTLENMRQDVELLALRVAGDSAAFHFRVRTELPDGAAEIEPIDVMTFDEAGRITTMRAFWSPEDVHLAQ